MIEIIAGLCVSSFFFSWVFAGLYLLLVVNRRAGAPEKIRLNENLGKIGLFWSTTEDRFQSLQKSNIERDRRKSLKSYLLMTLIFSLLSLLGLLLNVIMNISLGFLARSRLEMNALASPLSREELAPAEIEKIVKMLEEGTYIR